MSTRYNPPYDVPREAEIYVSGLIVGAVRITLDVFTYSVFPGLALLTLAFAQSHFVYEGWPDFSHVGVSFLAALSFGCVRLYLNRDQP